jgi:hypothetical protein
MKKITLLLIPIIGILLFSGCAGSRSGSTEERGSSDRPSWVDENPCLDPSTVLCGIGQAKKQNPSLGRQVATARARTEISQSVNSKVSSMLKDIMQESGVGDNAQALEFSEGVTKQVSNNTLEGSILKKSYTAKDNTIFVLVEYSLDSVRKDAVKAARNEEALWNEFKAKQSLDELEKALQNMK